MLWSLGACAAHQAPSAPAAPPDPQIAESAPAGGDAAPVPGDNRPVPEASTCNKTRLFEVGSTGVWQTPGKKVFFFSAGMTIDADGAPDAYHPDNIGTDHLGNAGRPGNWWALVTDNGEPSGNPLVQQAEDPKPGF